MCFIFDLNGLYLEHIFLFYYFFVTYVMHELTRSERRLLDAMQKDTTLSQIDLAELSGKSRTSIWRLIREFEEAGLIEGKVALLNPKELGLQIHVMLSVSMVKHSDRTRQEFEAHVQILARSDGMLFRFRRSRLCPADHFKGHGILQHVSEHTDSRSPQRALGQFQFRAAQGQVHHRPAPLGHRHENHY